MYLYYITYVVIVRPVGKTGVMFLDEIILGKEYFIAGSDGSLVKAPNGYDSVVYLGGDKPGIEKKLSCSTSIYIPSKVPSHL